MIESPLSSPHVVSSGFSFDTFILQGQQLQLVAHREEGITSVQAATVERFYELLGQKDLKGAYALLADPTSARPNELRCGWRRFALHSQSCLTSPPGA